MNYETVTMKEAGAGQQPVSENGLVILFELAEQQMSVAELAREIGVKRTTLSRALHSTSGPGDDVVRQCFQILNVDHERVRIAAQYAGDPLVHRSAEVQALKIMTMAMALRLFDKEKEPFSIECDKRVYELAADRAVKAVCEHHDKINRMRMAA